MTFLEKIDAQPRTTKGVVLLTTQEWVWVKSLGHALDDIANGRLNVTDAVGQIGVYTAYIHGDFVGYAIRYAGERAYFEPATA